MLYCSLKMPRKPSNSPSESRSGLLFGTALVVLNAAMLAQSPPPRPPDLEALPPAKASSTRSSLPPDPKGRSTVIGGVIRDVDPVRDQFTLKVFGGKPVKVLFDERTEVFRDGVRISLLDLHSNEHASVETTLDGVTVFALRIHMLSQQPEGQSRARVLSYNPATGELVINVALSEQPIKLRVPAGTPVVHVGQDADSAQQGGLSGLTAGSVVDVKFTGGKGGQGVVTHMDILATPGSAFLFSGKVSSLDLHAGRLVVVDPRDGKTYPILFDPARLPISSELHNGSDVRVTTSFDGTRYTASQIKIQ